MRTANEASVGAAAVRSWMESYKSAWEHLDRTGIVGLFSSRTRVAGDPFEQPVGHGQLRTLWDDLAARQCDNFLEFDIINAFERRAYVHWRCLTTNPQKRVRRQGHGVFALEFDGQACTNQTEWSRWSKDVEGAPSLPLGKIRSVMRQIDHHLGDSITIPRLADMNRLSSRHATRLFRIFVGLPIHQYVLRQRLNRARERLAWGTGSIADVAYDLGFANQAHLISAFRRSTAFTPGEYRSRFSQAGRGPVHRWLTCFGQSVAAGDDSRVMDELDLPTEYRAIRERRGSGSWLDGLTLEVLADTPSTALVHWRLPRIRAKSGESTGDGILVLKFAPEGSCYRKENFSHWQAADHLPA